MRKTSIIIVGIVILIAGIGIGFYASDYLRPKTVRPAEVKKEAKKQRKILYYRNPMNPSITSPTPKKDAMGMDYIPVYEGEEETEAPGTVTISPEKIQEIGVRSEPVQYRVISKDIRTTGIVTYDERRLSQIRSKVSGWIEKLIVNTTGQFVKKGEPLFEIYSPDLVTAQQEYLVALEAYDKFKASGDTSPFANLLDAARQKLRYWDISDKQINQLSTGKKITKTMYLYSPVTGIVIEKPAALKGMAINPGDVLYQIGDISKVWIDADIYEYEASEIREGQRARITLPYDPGEVFYGRVNYVYPYIKADTRTLKARIDMPNRGWKLRPDMYANVEIEVGGQKRLSVPASAVIDTGLRQVVIVDLGNGRFAPRNVTVGLRGDEYWEILKGLNEGEKVVTTANFLIDSESNLKAALAAMPPPESTPKEGRKAGETSPKPAKPTEAGKEGKKQRRILYYRNPMNPSITSATPRKDEMGMDYIPVYEGEENINKETPVQTAPVKKAPDTSNQDQMPSEHQHKMD